MNYSDIQARLAIIKALAISELDKRQPLLVELLADIVNGETSNGECTDGGESLEGQDWWNTLSHLTRDAGFKKLGNGHFSAAYSHEMLPGRVIKVGFKKEDSGAAYVAFCRMMQGKVGIPNVHHVERHAGCYTVVLDHLQPCDRSIESHDMWADIAREFVASDSYDADDYEEEHQDFIATCKEIRKFFKGIAAFDMHSGNIMFAEDGTPFITDPVSFSHDREREAFPLDPEALLAEIEAAAAAALIERCKARKAKCNPQGTFWIDHKANMKRRKRQRKYLAREKIKCDALFVKNRLMHKANMRNEQRAADYLGSAWQAVWLKNDNLMVRQIDQVNAIKWQLADQLAIQAARPLNIDVWMDKQLMG